MHYAMITFSAAVEYIRSERLRCSGTVLAAGAAPPALSGCVTQRAVAKTARSARARLD
jgi:hypothetical protein